MKSRIDFNQNLFEPLRFFWFHIFAIIVLSSLFSLLISIINLLDHFQVMIFIQMIHFCDVDAIQKIENKI